MIVMSEQSELEIEWTTDDSAMVRGPRYHDGRLVSIHIDRQQVEVVIDAVGGGQTRFRFLGAEFGSIGLVSHAIVSDVFAFPIHKSDDPDPAMSEAIHVLNGGMIPMGDIIMESGFMLRQHESLLVFFTCSYGGPFSILCHRMIVTRRGY
jgi:hypothetical protein